MNCFLIIKILSSLFYWCSANQIRVRLASLELDGLLSYTKGCTGRWFGHTSSKLKLASNKDVSNYFEWLYTLVAFSCFSRGYYRANGIIAIALMLHSYLFCGNDCHQCRNQTLARESTPSSLRGLGNRTKQNPLTGAICGCRARVLDHVVDYAFTFINVVDCT